MAVTDPRKPIAGFKGLHTEIPSNLLDPRWSPNCGDIVVRQGAIFRRPAVVPHFTQKLTQYVSGRADINYTQGGFLWQTNQIGLLTTGYTQTFETLVLGDLDLQDTWLKDDILSSAEARIDVQSGYKVSGNQAARPLQTGGTGALKAVYYRPLSDPTQECVVSWDYKYPYGGTVQWRQDFILAGGADPDNDYRVKVSVLWNLVGINWQARVYLSDALGVDRLVTEDLKGGAVVNFKVTITPGGVFVLEINDPYFGQTLFNGMTKTTTRMVPTYEKGVSFKKDLRVTGTYSLVTDNTAVTVGNQSNRIMLISVNIIATNDPAWNWPVFSVGDPQNPVTWTVGGVVQTANKISDWPGNLIDYQYQVSPPGVSLTAGMQQRLFAIMAPTVSATPGTISIGLQRASNFKGPINVVVGVVTLYDVDQVNPFVLGAGGANSMEFAASPDGGYTANGNKSLQTGVHDLTYLGYDSTKGGTHARVRHHDCRSLVWIPSGTAGAYTSPSNMVVDFMFAQGDHQMTVPDGETADFLDAYTFTGTAQPNVVGQDSQLGSRHALGNGEFSPRYISWGDTGEVTGISNDKLARWNGKWIDGSFVVRGAVTAANTDTEIDRIFLQAEATVSQWTSMGAWDNISITYQFTLADSTKFFVIQGGTGGTEPRLVSMPALGTNDLWDSPVGLIASTVDTSVWPVFYRDIFYFPGNNLSNTTKKLKDDFTIATLGGSPEAMVCSGVFNRLAFNGIAGGKLQFSKIDDVEDYLNADTLTAGVSAGVPSFIWPMRDWALVGCDWGLFVLSGFGRATAKVLPLSLALGCTDLASAAGTDKEVFFMGHHINRRAISNPGANPYHGVFRVAMNGGDPEEVSAPIRRSALFSSALPWGTQRNNVMMSYDASQRLLFVLAPRFNPGVTGSGGGSRLWVMNESGDWFPWNFPVTSSPTGDTGFKASWVVTNAMAGSTGGTGVWLGGTGEDAWRGVFRLDENFSQDQDLDGNRFPIAAFWEFPKIDVGDSAIRAVHVKSAPTRQSSSNWDGEALRVAYRMDGSDVWTYLDCNADYSVNGGFGLRPGGMRIPLPDGGLKGKSIEFRLEILSTAPPGVNVSSFEPEYTPLGAPQVE